MLRKFSHLRRFSSALSTQISPLTHVQREKNATITCRQQYKGCYLIHMTQEILLYLSLSSIISLQELFISPTMNFWGSVNMLVILVGTFYMPCFHSVKAIHWHLAENSELCAVTQTWGLSVPSRCSHCCITEALEQLSPELFPDYYDYETVIR